MKRTMILVAAVIALLCAFTAAASAVQHGDVDGNDKIEAADARLALRIAVGLPNDNVQNYHPEAADVVKAFGKVEAADARMILRCAVNLEDLTNAHVEKVIPGKPATCTEAGISDGVECTSCGKTLKEQKVISSQHVFTDVTKDPAAKIVCSRCGKEFPSFNEMVNILKTENHYYTGFSETESGGTLISSKFSPATLEKLLKEEMEKGMFEEGVEYGDRISSPRLITDYSFEVAGKPHVSALTADDVKDLKVEEQVGLDFMEKLPDVLELKYGGATVKEDITALKATDIGPVKKVSVTLKQEKLSKLKNSGAESALQRIMDMDLRELAEYSNMSQTEDVEIGNITMSMNCSEIVSDCTVTYYFDSETLKPIAAVYDVDMTMAENTEIKLTDKLFGASLASGKMAFNVDNNNTRYYFFDNYYKY